LGTCVTAKLRRCYYLYARITPKLFIPDEGAS
jgi:hypothetical protein